MNIYFDYSKTKEQKEIIMYCSLNKKTQEQILRNKYGVFYFCFFFQLHTYFKQAAFRASYFFFV